MNIFYTTVVGAGGRSSHSAAERAFVERAQALGYQAVVFNGDEAGTATFSHITTTGPVRNLMSAAADQAVARLRAQNPELFDRHEKNANAIAEVLQSMHKDLPGIVVNVIAR